MQKDMDKTNYNENDMKDCVSEDSMEFVFTEKSTDSDEKITADTVSRSDPTGKYLSEIGFSELLSREMEHELAIKYAAGDKEAYKKLVEANLRLVVKISRKYTNRGLAFLDVIEEGNFGLMHAIEKYDVSRGLRLSTYATWWVRQSIERAIMNQSRTVRLPVHIIKEMNTYLRAGYSLASQLDHEATADEIAKQIDKPIEDINRVLKFKSGAASLDKSINEEGDVALKDTISYDENDDPYDVIADDNIKQILDKWLVALDELEHVVIVRRFGLQGHDVHTLEDTAMYLGLTREKIRQVQIRAIKKLRKSMNFFGISSDDII